MPAEQKTAPIALCPGCGEPLISTFAFSGYEFLCICCARRVTFFGPSRGDGDDERLRGRLAELQAEWDEHAGGGKLMPRCTFWLEGCATCRGEEGPREDHWLHVTDEERAADERARAWLKERVGG